MADTAILCLSSAWGCPQPGALQTESSPLAAVAAEVGGGDSMEVMQMASGLEPAWKSERAHKHSEHWICLNKVTAGKEGLFFFLFFFVMLLLSITQLSAEFLTSGIYFKWFFCLPEKGKLISQMQCMTCSHSLRRSAPRLPRCETLRQRQAIQPKIYSALISPGFENLLVDFSLFSSSLTAVLIPNPFQPSCSNYPHGAWGISVIN